MTRSRHNKYSRYLRMVTGLSPFLPVLVTIWAATVGASVHPTLFFDPTNLVSLRKKQERGLYRDSRDLLLYTVDWARRIQIPREPRVVARKVNPEGTYNPDGLKSSKLFLDAGVTIQSVLPVFGLCYHLTGDEKYADRAVEWLNAYTTWENFDVNGPDIQGAASLVGMVVGYDMFLNNLNDDERLQLISTIKRLTKAFVRKAARLSRLPLKGNRVRIATNHNVVPVCAAGLGALLLKLEGEDDGRMLKTVIDCFRNAILPSAFSPEGEYVDGTGPWLVYVMQSMAIFFEALRRNDGPNLWEEGNLRRVPEFLIQADSLCAADAPYEYRWRYTLLAMAGVYRDSELQGLALRKGLMVGSGAKELSFSQHEAPEDRNKVPKARGEGLEAERESNEGGRPVKRWFSAVWEYLFYDDTVRPIPLKPRALSVRFPHLGRVIMRSSWNQNASIVYFRAGPRIGKDHGDNNAFQLTAFGYDLLPMLDAPFWPLSERRVESYAEKDWIYGTHGNNTIVVNGTRQYSMLDKEYLKANGPKREYPDWLAGPEEGVSPQAEILSFVSSPLMDYVSGEAGNAYRDDKGGRLLDIFLRHLFFIKDEYLLVLDEIKCSQGLAHEIEWIFHAGKNNALQLSDSEFTIYPLKQPQAARLDARVLSPAVVIRPQRVSVRQESYRSPYVSIRQVSRKNQVLSIFVMGIRKGIEPRREASLIRNNDRSVVLTVGHDVVVLNKTNEPFSHGDLSFSGRAAWIRPSVSAVLVEGTWLKWKGNTLIELKNFGSGYWRS